MGSLNLPKNLPDGIYQGFIAPDKVGLVLLDSDTRVVGSGTKTIERNPVTNNREMRCASIVDAMRELSMAITEQEEMRTDLQRTLGISIGVERIEIDDTRKE
jgi:hypothetical protein